MDAQRIAIRGGWMPRRLRQLIVGGVIAALVSTGGAPSVRAEGGDYGDGLTNCTTLPTAVVSGTGTIANGSLSLSAGGTLGYALSQRGTATGTRGNWQVQFTNVSNDSLDGAVFATTSIASLKFCQVADEPFQGATFHADGTLNGTPGYSIKAQVIDRGNGSGDSIQVALFNVPVSGQSSSTPIYGSLTDFPATPVPTNRLTNGNYQIQTKGKPTP